MLPMRIFPVNLPVPFVFLAFLDTTNRLSGFLHGGFLGCTSRLLDYKASGDEGPLGAASSAGRSGGEY